MRHMEKKRPGLERGRVHLRRKAVYALFFRKAAIAVPPIRNRSALTGSGTALTVKLLVPPNNFNSLPQSVPVT